MFAALLKCFFGCWHEFGFPMTDPTTHRTYQVCLNCGVEYEYDWEHMTRLGRMPRPPQREYASTRQLLSSTPQPLSSLTQHLDR